MLMPTSTSAQKRHIPFATVAWWKDIEDRPLHKPEQHNERSSRLVRSSHSWVYISLDNSEFQKRLQTTYKSSSYPPCLRPRSFLLSNLGEEAVGPLADLVKVAVLAFSRTWSRENLIRVIENEYALQTSAHLHTKARNKALIWVINICI